MKAPAAPLPSAPAPETVSFADLGLADGFLAVLTRLGFERPTPIQAAALPPLLAGRDVIGRARTGTGKTAAFGLPLLAGLPTRPSGRPQALVLAPTRELALQVTEALKELAARPLRIITVYGGAPYGAQLRALREGVEVVVGTPGRIIDLMDRKSLILAEVKLVVLDEADEMLKMGFIDDVERVLSETPEGRQVALFSATMPAPIKKVAERWLKDPVEATDAAGASIAAIQQRFVQVPPRNKREALLRILRGEPRGAAIIFASTKIHCAEVAEMLVEAGFAAEELHGDLSQPARERVLQLLRDKRVDIVVATDIAARGIDIDHLTHIINIDLPKTIENYTHRIGRTGRAGRTGTAITLVAPRDVEGFVRALERGGARIEEMYLPSDAELVRRQREALAAELRTWLGPAATAAASAEGDAAAANESSDASDPAVPAPAPAPVLRAEPTEARRWMGQLIASGFALEDVATAALGLLAKARAVSLEATPDKGLPPWARQPTAPPPKQRAKPGKPPLPEAAPSERHVPEAPARRPAAPGGGQEEAWLHLGVGRAQNIRPTDVVGALANELGLTGATIGRIEVRDLTTLVQVMPEFAERLGNGVWPVQIRGVDTEVRVHAPPRPTTPHAPRPHAGKPHAPPAPRPTAPHAAHPKARTTPHAPRPHTTKAGPTGAHRAPHAGPHGAGDRRPRVRQDS